MRQIGLPERCRRAQAALGGIPALTQTGRVTGSAGLAIDVAGLGHALTLGDRVLLQAGADRTVPAEVIGFRDGFARVLPFGTTQGLGAGSPVTLGTGVRGVGATLAVDDGWIGRVVDPLGHPLDGRGALAAGVPRPVRAAPPEAAGRARLGPRLDLGVGVLNAFTTCREGQRLGLFAGSGVGKSTLLAMLARHTGCDVAVLALVGERGREVREFLEDDLGEAGLGRAVVIVATSDAPALLRREAAYAATTIAEHFRDRGQRVLLLMDSVTRFCLALREIALAAGEPPATRGYPPSVFAELPGLLERAGPGPAGTGSITALYTVLVEGDDQNEPVADAVRGILDGHVVLDRRIAEAGRYPAVDVLRSLSRTVPNCLTPDEAAIARAARSVLATYADLADLLRLGAYRTGSDPEADRAVALAPRIEALLQQSKTEAMSIDTVFGALAGLLAEAA